MSASWIIQVKQLRKNFGNKEVLCGIDMDVSAGQIIGYIGPNGAGKSTTVKIFCGLIDHFEGEVSIFGKDIRQHILEIKKRTGYIPENASLYEALTPIEFMEFIGEIRKIDKETVRLKTKSLMELFDMKAVINQRIATFSKGMRQKVLICSALLHNPELIFMDEPLTGLDANSVIMVKDVLEFLKSQGKTIFYSSHIMDVVEKISDRIIIIDTGRVIADGTFKELQSKSGDSSLEKLFTRLTGNAAMSDKAELLKHSLGY
jgi:ABC-2 type transport system ATP-binding protein